MRFLRPRRLLLALLAGCLVATAGGVQAQFAEKPAETRGGEGDFPEEWREIEARLPAFPEEAALIEFPNHWGGERYRYFIDSGSLSRGKDDVMRYTVLIRPVSGAADFVSFEGLRCKTREYREYARGSRGRFVDTGNSTWRRVDGSGTYAFRRSLLQGYLCDADGLTRSAEDALAQLNSARGPDMRGGSPVWNTR